MNSSLRVLLVEDSENDALIIIHILKAGGYEPVWERVETAAAMCKALLEQPWDLILSDYRLPRFNGLEALALLKETGIDIPFILFSGTIGEETAVAAMKAGAHDFVMKDKLSRLIPAIDRELKEAEVRQKGKWTEAALRESREVEKSILLSVPHALFGVEQRRIFFANEAMEDVFGWKPEELIGKSTRLIFP